MHPDSHPASLVGDWPAETTASGRFTDPHVQTFGSMREYGSAEYAMLLQTPQDHILLEPTQRTDLMTAIVDAIDAQGGIIRLPLATCVCLARRA